MSGPRGRRPTATRRRLLAAVGAGLSTGVAGCAGRFDDPSELLGESDPQYDADAIRAVGEAGVPRPPATFPASIPDAAFERHRERARELLDAVPTDPGATIPNGAVAHEIASDRANVHEDLRRGDKSGATQYEATPRLARLGHWRYVRSEAAAVRGTYRAATGDVDPAELRESRDRLRSDLYEFLDGWEYRGPDPVSALVVHGEIEEMVESVRRSAQSSGPLPSDPTAAASRFGEEFGDVERGRAILADAKRIRRRYVDAGGDAVTSHRDAVAGTFERMRATLHATARGVEEYADESNRADPPFDRKLEGTPAEYVYNTAVQNYDGRRRSLDRTRRRGQIATGTLSAGVGLAAKESLARVVESIRAGEYESPSDDAAVRASRERAVDGLRTVWNTEPAAVSAELARPAADEVHRAVRTLTDGDGDENEVNRAVGGFAYAAVYADAVVTVVDHTVETLRSMG